MLEFCPECESLLRRRVIEGIEHIACRCGYKRKIEGQTSYAAVSFIPKKTTPRKIKMKTVSWDPPEASMVYAKMMNAPESKSSVILKMIQDKLESKYYNCSKCTQIMSANTFCKLHERKVDKKDICKSFEPVLGVLGAKKVSRRSNDDKNGSASKANRRCGKCIFYQNKHCHAHKKDASANDASCEDFEYIYERSDELLHRKD